MVKAIVLYTKSNLFWYIALGNRSKKIRRLLSKNLKRMVATAFNKTGLHRKREATYVHGLIRKSSNMVSINPTTQVSSLETWLDTPIANKRNDNNA